MKKALSIRTIVLLSLVAFALLVVGLASLASWQVRVGSYRLEQSSLLDDLEVIARQLEDNLSDGTSNPYEFIETTYQLQDSARWDFFYVLQDHDYVIEAPKALQGKKIAFHHTRTYRTKTSKEVVMTAEILGRDCFVVPYHIPDRPLVLLGIYQESYIFGDRRFAVSSFILVLTCLLAVLFVICWFWVLPYLRRVVFARDQAEDRLNRAREMQQKAVTQVFPSDPRVDCFGVLHAMQEVGGDIYHCELMEDRLDFSIGDVSGKGPAAALLMFLVSGFLHSRSRYTHDVAQLMKECNGLLVDNKEFDFFCTLLLGSIDLRTRELTYCNAGHMKMLINGAYLNQPSQIVAGAFEDYPYSSEKVTLPAGSRILLYTDGVTDTRSADGRFFGTDGLRDWASALDPSLPSREVCHRLLDTLAAFRGKEAQTDDIAILCIQIQ